MNYKTLEEITTLPDDIILNISGNSYICGTVRWRNIVNKHYLVTTVERSEINTVKDFGNFGAEESLKHFRTMSDEQQFMLDKYEDEAHSVLQEMRGGNYVL